MAAAKEVQGKDFMLFLDGKAIALATACKLTINGEYGDSKTKDSGKWTKKVPRNVTWSGSSDNFFSADPEINGYDTLFSALLEGKELKAQFGISANAVDATDFPEGGWSLPDTSYEGYVVITSLDLNAPVDGEATFTVSFDGSGKIEKTTKAKV